MTNIAGPDPGFAKRGGRVSKLRENWLIWPQNRLNLHDLVVKRGGGGAGPNWPIPGSAPAVTLASQFKQSMILDIRRNKTSFILINCSIDLFTNKTKIHLLLYNFVYQLDTTQKQTTAQFIL